MPTGQNQWPGCAEGRRAACAAAGAAEVGDCAPYMRALHSSRPSRTSP